MSPFAAEPSSADKNLISKVLKLLAMAEGSPNHCEADAFSAKAAQLIAEHRIDPTRLAAERDDALDVIEVGVGRGAYVRGRLALLTVIAQSQGATVVFETRRDGTVALVAGYWSDLTRIEMLYRSLHTQAASRMALEKRATGAATQRWRRGFLFGYANQLQVMFDQVARVAEQQPGRASSLPVLRHREQVVAGFAATKFGRVRTARQPRAAQASAYAAGQAAARRADLGRSRVNGQRALPGGR